MAQKENASVRIVIMLTPTVAAQLAAKAGAEDRSLSDMGRRIITDALAPTDPECKTDETE